MTENTILTIEWIKKDVTTLAEERGIDPQKALEAVEDSIRLVEDRSIETGWEVIGFILDDLEN